jgi:twinkle protein
MWEEISTPKNYETCPYPWEGMNYMTYGIRLSELVIVTAETGVGKTSVLKEIEYNLLSTTDKGVGFLHLEEPNSDTALGLMSIDANKPLHLPDVRAEVTKDELRKHYDTVINNDRVVIWDHFGSNSVHEVLNKIRHMHNLGCKYIVLDHLSIVVSDQSGDERKQLDEITTKLKTLCMELNIAVIAVIHQNRAGQIRGTAGVEQLANIVIKLHRDKEDPDEWRRNVTKIVVQKNRFCGRTGPGVYLWYCPETGRLLELDKDQIVQYESGATGKEMW